MKIANSSLPTAQNTSYSKTESTSQNSFEDMINDKLNETSKTLPNRAEKIEKPDKAQTSDGAKVETSDKSIAENQGENVTAPVVATTQMQNLLVSVAQTQMGISSEVNAQSTTANVMQTAEFATQAATNINQGQGLTQQSAQVVDASIPVINEAQQAQINIPISSVDTQTNTANAQLQQPVAVEGVSVDTNGAQISPEGETFVNQMVNTDSDETTQPVITTQIEVKPLDPNNVNIKVADIQNADQAALVQDVAEEIIVKVTENIKEFDIELNPANLGKISIKIEFTPEQAIVSISSNNAQTQGLMAANAENIRQIIEANVGQQTFVTVQENSDMGQYRDNGDLQQESQNKQQQDTNSGRQTHDESIDFIQKLRLGLSDYVSV